MTLAERIEARGYKKGLEEGKAEGVSLEKNRMAVNLLKMGMEFSTITEITGLSLAHVKALVERVTN